MSRSRPTQANTFFLTNMAPQYEHLNSRAWGTLEDYVRSWAKKYGHVHVITGSVFDRDGDGQPDGLSQTRWTKPSKRVGAPSHSFKIVVREAPGGDLIPLAVLLPNKSQGLGKGGDVPSAEPDQRGQDQASLRDRFLPAAWRRHQGPAGAGCGV